MNQKRVLQLDVIGWLVVHIPFVLQGRQLPLGEVVITTGVELDIACGKDGMDI